MNLLAILLFIFNVLLLLCGGALCGFGLWLIFVPEVGYILNIIDSAGMDIDLWTVSVYIVTVVGGVVFVVALLGCLGATTGKKFFLISHGTIIVFVILLEIGACVLAGLFCFSMDYNIGIKMQKDVKTKYTGEEPRDTWSRNWNTMQINLECCGSFNYTDYEQSYFANTTKATVPWTCCRLRSSVDKKYATKTDVLNYDSCQKLNSNYVHRTGCYDELDELLYDIGPILIGVTCGFIGLQIISLLFSCFLRCKKNADVGPAKI